MGKKIGEKGIVLVLCFTMMMGILSLFSISEMEVKAEDDQISTFADLTDKVTVSSFDLFNGKTGDTIDKNKGTDPDNYTNYLEYGGNYGMFVYFTVDNGTTLFAEGDTFSFDFPVLESANGTVTNSEFKATIGGVDVVIGTWSTEIKTDSAGKRYGALTATLNDKVTTYSQLGSAWVKIPDVGNSYNSALQSEKIQDITLGTITNQYRVHGRYPQSKPLTDLSDIKYAVKGDTDTSIAWQIHTGYELINNLHAANGAPEVPGKPLTASNIVIDTLKDSAGHKATAVTRIGIGSMIYAPMSLTDSTGNVNAVRYPELTSYYTRTDATAVEYPTVDAYAAALAVNHYGVYTADDGTLSVVFNFGTMGVDTPVLEDILPNYATQLADYTVNYSGFYESSDYNNVLEAIKKIYGKDNALGGRINFMEISINAEYPKSVVSLDISNTAKTTIKGDLEGGFTLTPPDSGSAVAPYEIRVLKYDSVTGEAIPGVELKLQKKDAVGQWLDSSGSSTGESKRITSAEGAAVWKDVLPGVYRVIEVKAAEGYLLGTIDVAAGGVIASEEIQVPEKNDKGHILKVKNVKAPSTDVTLKVSKKVDGTGAPEETYSFNLAGVASNPSGAGGSDLMPPLPDQLSATAKAGETAQFGTITYTTAGEYNYTITEIQGTTEGMTYDATSHSVKVTVTEENGALKAAVSYNGDSSLTVINTYVAPPTPTPPTTPPTPSTPVTPSTSIAPTQIRGDGSVQTGDNTNVNTYAILLLISATAIVTVCVRKHVI